MAHVFPSQKRSDGGLCWALALFKTRYQNTAKQSKCVLSPACWWCRECLRNAAQSLKPGLRTGSAKRWGLRFQQVAGLFIYPLVICYIAIENGHWNSWFTHENRMVIFPPVFWDCLPGRVVHCFSSVTTQRSATSSHCAPWLIFRPM